MAPRQPQRAGKGGDVIFTPGKGGPASYDRARGVDGAIIFRDANGQEWLRLESHGKAYVRGEPVTCSVDVFDEFVAWLAAARLCCHKGVGDGQPSHYDPME